MKTPRTTREIALLVNPVAGGGRRQREVAAVVARMRDAGIVVRELVGADAEDSAKLAREAVAAGADGLVVCGGDGTVNIGANVLAGTSTPLGIIPMGSGNDAARALALPAKDVIAATDVVIGARTRVIDLARCGDRHFVTVMAAGFDALVAERAERMSWPEGGAKYAVAVFALLRRFRPIHYTLVLDGETTHVHAMLAAVGNTDRLGGGLRVTHGAEVDDGLLDVVVFTSVSKLELVKTFPKLYTGGHVTHPAYQRHRVERVTVAAPGIVAYADGDRLGELPLTVEVAPRALTVFA